MPEILTPAEIAELRQRYKQHLDVLRALDTIKAQSDLLREAMDFDHVHGCSGSITRPDAWSEWVYTPCKCGKRLFDETVKAIIGEESL